MIEDVNEAKRRLRTAWQAPGRGASRNQDVGQAKEHLRDTARPLIGICVFEAQWCAAAELRQWVQQSPWQAVLTAFVTGAVLAGRDVSVLQLITRLVDLAAVESLRSRSRNAAAQDASLHQACPTARCA